MSIRWGTAAATAVAVLVTVTQSVAYPSAADDISSKAPEQAPAGDLAHVLEIRQQLGLRSDEAWVSTMEAAAPDGHSRANLFGIAATEAEAKVIEDYVSFAGRAGRAQAHLDALKLAGGAGSAIVATPDGPTVRYYFKAGSVPDKESVARFFSRDELPRVSLESVRYSGDELETTVHEISRQLNRSGTPNGGVSINTIENRVDVELPEDQTAVRTSIVAAYPADKVAVVAGAAMETELLAGPYKNELPGYDLMFAGLAIGTSALASTGSAPGCTSGFAVQSGFGPFILTAAHCVGAAGQSWYQGGMKFGQATGTETDYLTDGVDAALITTFGWRPTRSRLHEDYIDWYQPVTFIAGNSPVGSPVCNYGYKTTGMSGLQNSTDRCGTVTSLCADPPDLPGSNGCYHRANFRADHGDSGSAIAFPTGYGFGAEGLISNCALYPGTSNCATPFRIYFSSMAPIASRWGLQLSPWQ